MLRKDQERVQDLKKWFDINEDLLVVETDFEENIISCWLKKQ